MARTRAALLRRTALAVPAALGAIALFAATEPAGTWTTFEAETVNEARVDLDAAGTTDALVTVVIVGDLPPSSELRVTVFGDDVPRWLDVAPGDEPRAADSVRKRYAIARGLPGACEEQQADDTDTDTDTDRPGPSNVCTIDVPLRFEGRAEESVTVRVSAEVGTYDQPPPEADLVVDMDYDPDPPVAD